MPPHDELTDDFLAQLLSKDAKVQTSRYSSHGIQELLPKRPTSNAPKPNTRFLKNIIRETDSHNAALRKQESRDSQTRLRDLRGGQQRHARGDGRLTQEHDSRGLKRRRPDDDGYHDRNSRLRARSQSPGRSDRKKDPERRHRQHPRDARVHDGTESEDSTPSRLRLRDRHRHHDRNGSYHSKHKKRYSRHSTSSSPLEEHYADRHHKARRRYDATSRTADGRHCGSERHKGHRESNRSSRILDTEDKTDTGVDPGGQSPDSDPLESLIGPAPPPPKPAVKYRGRGTLSSTSGIDARFATNYDPDNDAHPDPEQGTDDWDQALEALRDRQKWQQRGAERLKAAGFSEDEVAKWVSGKSKGLATERDEGDVQWKSKAEGREWDRGKVVTADGVATEFEWGRLKDN